MTEKVSVQSVTDLITSQRGNQYFTFEDMSQKRYVCYNPNLKEYCKVGSEIEADLTLGKTPEDSPRLDMIYVNGKPVIQVEKKATGRSYGKSDKELLQIKQLAEAQNRSIQAQTALNRAVEIGIATDPSLAQIKKDAKEFYQLLQSLTLISEAEVIHKKIEEAKDETTKVSKNDKVDNKPEDEGKSAGQDSNEGKSPETAGQLFNWIMSKDKNIKVPRVWCQTEYGLGDKEVLTDKKVQELYVKIKKDKGW